MQFLPRVQAISLLKEENFIKGIHNAKYEEEKQ